MATHYHVGMDDDGGPPHVQRWSAKCVCGWVSPMSSGHSLASKWLHQHIRREEGLGSPKAHEGQETIALTAKELDQIVMAARLEWKPMT